MGRTFPFSVNRIANSEASRTSHWAENLTHRGAGVIPSGEQEGGNQRLSNLLNALNAGGSSLGGVPRPSVTGNTADASAIGGTQQVHIQDLQNILQSMGFQQNEAQAAAAEAAEAGPTPASASRGEVPQPMEEENNSNNVGQSGSGGDQEPESVPEQPATGELSRGAIADLSSSPPPSENASENQNNDQKSPE